VKIAAVAENPSSEGARGTIQLEKTLALTPALSPTGTIQLKYSFSRVCWVYVFAHSTA
jgi:hypothetical protein